MNTMNIFRHWTQAHHFNRHDFSDFSIKLVHNSAFWTVIALIVFLALLIVLAMLSSGSATSQPYFPRHTPYTWPIMP